MLLIKVFATNCDYQNRRKGSMKGSDHGRIFLIQILGFTQLALQEYPTSRAS